MERSLIQPTGRGILDPGTGRPVSDTYFGVVNRELADRASLSRQPMS